MRSVVGLEGISRQHLYRTCRFLAEHKVRIEQELFARHRTLFDETVDLVFFDTTSTYFEGRASSFAPVRPFQGSSAGPGADRGRGSDESAGVAVGV